MDVDKSNDSEDLGDLDTHGRDEVDVEFFVPPPPLSAFVASEDGSRIIITKIANENFKSYAGRQELGPFHKYFTAIMGPNGSGKSNVIDSMLFVFGYRASRLRSKKISALLHDSPNFGKATSCTVTVHFASMKDIPSDPDKYELVPGSEFYISRTANADNSSFYTVNGKRVQFKEVSDKLRRYGIDLVHNRFLILQGEVEQISLMKPIGDEHDTGMLEYLEDIIGSSRFKEPIEQCTVKVQKLSEDKDEKRVRSRMAMTELDQLQAPKDAAMTYIEMENIIIMLNNQLLQKKIAMGEVDKAEKAEELAKVEETMKELKNKLAEIKKQSQALEKAHEEKLHELERVGSLKEKMKAEFDAKKQRDVLLQQEVERSNKKRKELAKSLAAEQEKKISLEKVPVKNQETITDLEAMEVKLEEERQQAEQKNAEVLASLKKDTIGLQEEKEVLQTELAGLLRTVDEAKAKYEVGNTDMTLYRSRQDNETKKLDDLTKRLDDIVSGAQTRNQECEKLNKVIQEKEKKVKEEVEEVGKLRLEERSLDEDRRKLQITVEEARSSMQSNRSRGKVLDALMQAKQSGELPGVFGRMGDLGGIDAKYDVAISTAAGALDHIVVDSVDTAEACIMFLKKNDIGRASFVALDKQEHYRQVYSRPFRAPENVSRLFDLIQTADDRIRPAFYYALHDTLVATDLEQASRIAYGATRYRVVTLAGELIEVAGTMSGGGKQVLRGRMGRKAEQTKDSVSPRDMERMERSLEDQTKRLMQVRKQIAALEEQISNNNAELTRARQQLNKLNQEIKSGHSQEPAIRSQIKIQEKKVKENTLDPKQLAQLQKVVDAAQKELDEASKASNEVEEKVKKIHAEIVAKTKGRLDAAQKKLDDVTSKLDKVRQEKTKLRVAVTTAARNLVKCEERIGNMQKEVENCVNRIKTNAAQIQENEEDAKVTLEEFQRIDDELKNLQANNTEYQKESEKIHKAEAELKSKEIDLKEDVSRAKAEYDARCSKISINKKRLKTLKLTEHPFKDQQPQLRVFTSDELGEMSADVILGQIKEAEETLPKTRPNLGAIQEYIKQKKVFLDREEELEKASDIYHKYKGKLDQMKETRLKEFSQGFQVISLKVKECYQMLAEGGDAELELVNTMDPFMDGIKFTVRPPKKSWKEIQYLSGGEKTLSSLALIFALHYYKPTPLYFMDEIDSALDWKNTAIVGFYLKEQTKNAQFIVVSLRENMFEIADQLVGIYKTENCTKSVTIIPHNYDEGGEDASERASFPPLPVVPSPLPPTEVSS